MQKGNNLHFNCIACEMPVDLSIFDLDHNCPLQCGKCGKKYLLNDPALVRQLKKFEALCRQIHESEEILGNASVGVDVGEHHVKVPYKLLLTRLNSSLELNMEGKKVAIAFRIEPIKDTPGTSTVEISRKGK